MHISGWTGLTEAEKVQYRRLRRGSFTPSMSLGEFDLKITDYRHDMKAYRRASHSTTATITTTTTTNNNLNDEDVLLVEAGIVDLDEHHFCAPLTKHKHTMKEALKRAAATQETEVTSYASSRPGKPPRGRSNSEGSAASRRAADAVFSSVTTTSSSNKSTTTTTTTKTTTTTTSRRGAASPFHRSMSQPGIPGSSAAVTVRIAGGTDLATRGGSSSRGQSFPRPAHSAVVDVGGHGQRERRALAKEIVVCPDYLVSRRRSSVGAVAGPVVAGARAGRK